MGGGWDDARMAQLRELWASGLSAARIAAEMGVSKNTVIGRVHRMGLPSRASPIGAARDGAPTAEQVAEIRRMLATSAATQREIADHLGLKPYQVQWQAARWRAEMGRASLPAGAAPSVGKVVLFPRPVRREPVPLRRGGSPHKVCQWIEGEPAGATSAFCGAGVVISGCSWCAAHHARVFRTAEERAA